VYNNFAGDCITRGFDPPRDTTVAREVDPEVAGTNSIPQLKPPRSYQFLWSDDSVRPEKALTIWMPLPPPGYDHLPRAQPSSCTVPTPGTSSGCHRWKRPINHTGKFAAALHNLLAICEACKAHSFDMQASTWIVSNSCVYAVGLLCVARLRCADDGRMSGPTVF